MGGRAWRAKVNSSQTLWLHYRTSGRTTGNIPCACMYAMCVYAYNCTMQALLSNPSVRQEVCCSHHSTDGVLRDFCDANFIKAHPVFTTHPDALHIQMLFNLYCSMMTSRWQILLEQRQDFIN